MELRPVSWSPARLYLKDVKEEKSLRVYIRFAIRCLGRDTREATDLVDFSLLKISLFYRVVLCC